jgi:hypothetical protein
MTNTFKVGDLITWSESAWAKHLHNQNNTSRFFVYSMPPAGFYKIVDIDIDRDQDLIYYVQSLENSRYERSCYESTFARDFVLASEKHQDNVELIFALDDIGLL